MCNLAASGTITAHMPWNMGKSKESNLWKATTRHHPSHDVRHPCILQISLGRHGRRWQLEHLLARLQMGSQVADIAHNWPGGPPRAAA
jgi:hypothetical protein